MQRNWIGKSEGAKIKFRLDNGKEIEIFTTRPDTIYGVTFIVFAPEHPLVAELVAGTEYEAKVQEFVRRARLTNKSQEKEGMFIGCYAVNPVNGERVPVYIGNFVLMEYGSGCVMAVPAHDQRDFEFAKKYGLPIKVVIQPEGKELNVEEMTEAYEGEGILVNSDKFSGMKSNEARVALIKFFEEQGIGGKAIEYKMRDWLVSRQRYWGTPIPILYCENCGIVPVPEQDLPVMLPRDVRFGEGNPLESNKSFVEAKCPRCHGNARRETDTLDTFFDSSWYFLRYCDPQNEKEAFEKKKVEYWMPVDFYIGGAEHAVMHLLYARFFTKVLRDLGLISFGEPFLRLRNQGIVTLGGEKMSKSKGNVVDPIEMIEKYNADTLRAYLLFVANPESQLEWSDKGIEGVYRFWKKVIMLSKKHVTSDTDNELGVYRLNKLIKDVTEAIENFEFPKAIISLMKFTDYLSMKQEVPRESYEGFIKLLSPFMPHTAEELWARLGNKDFVSIASWPQADSQLRFISMSYHRSSFFIRKRASVSMYLAYL